MRRAVFAFALVVGGCYIPPDWPAATDAALADTAAIPDGESFATVPVHVMDGGAADLPPVEGWQLENPLTDVMRGLWGDADGDVFALASGNRLRMRPAGSTTWVDRPLPIGALAQSITGTSASDLYVIGWNDVLHTNDAGAHYTTHPIPSGLDHPSRAWTDGVRLVVVGTTWTDAGEEGIIARSLDGGASWDPPLVTASAEWVGITGDASAIVVIGDDGSVARSVDGGAGWKIAKAVLPSYWNRIWSDGSTFYVAGNYAGPFVERSVDKGASWTPIVLPIETNVDGIRGNARGDLFLFGWDGTLVHRAPGASSWTVEPFPTNDDLADLWATPDAGLVVLSSSGRLFERAAGAATWNVEPAGLTPWLQAIAPSGRPGELYALGGGGPILHTVDSGDTWTPTDPGTHLGLYAATAHGDDILVVGAAGTMRRSRNAGASWAPVSSNTTGSLYGAWSDGAGGFVVVGAELILTSTDDGQHWSKLDLAGVDLYAVWGASAAEVYAAGATADRRGLIARGAVDGSWQLCRFAGFPYMPELYAVWGGGGDVFVVGEQGTALRSSDHGKSWDLLPTGSYGSLGAITGDGAGELLALEFDWTDTGQVYSTLFHSVDGGASWAWQWDDWATEMTRALTESPTGDVWSVGDAGMIMRRRRGP